MPYKTIEKRRAADRRKYAQNPQVKARAIQWRRDNPERWATLARRAQLKLKYGISPEQYDILFVAQGEACICGRKSGRHGRRLAVDHNHDTGGVRGLLCENCNQGLGLLKDNPTLLRALATYVERGGITKPEGLGTFDQRQR